MRRTVSTIATAAVLAVAVPACGGEGSNATSAGSPMTATAYRATLTAACVADSRASAELPAEQQRGHLTFTQLQRRARAIDHRFTSKVRSLRPPPSLRAEHRRLLALGRHPGPAHPTRAQAIAAAERARAVYRRIGVPGCAKPLDRSIGQLKGSEPG